MKQRKVTGTTPPVIHSFKTKSDGTRTNTARALSITRRKQKQKRHSSRWGTV